MYADFARGSDAVQQQMWPGFLVRASNVANRCPVYFDANRQSICINPIAKIIKANRTEKRKTIAQYRNSVPDGRKLESARGVKKSTPSTFSPGIAVVRRTFSSSLDFREKEAIRGLNHFKSLPARPNGRPGQVSRSLNCSS